MVYKKGRINIYLVLVIIIILIIAFCLFLFRTKNIVKINNEIIKVEVASTPIEQYKGLSNRDSICWDCGMLFVFPKKSMREFAMREMNYSLDIIFISDNRIVKISEKLMPEETNPLSVYPSGQEVNLVLEVNGGYVADKKIKVGDTIMFK